MRNEYRMAGSLAAALMMMVIPGRAEAAPAGPPEQTSQSSDAQRPAPMTALRGKLARRREDDIWMIENALGVVASESREKKHLRYCMLIVYGAERSITAAPHFEYALKSDGTVAVTQGRSVEQRYRDGEEAQLRLMTGGGALVQDCAGSLYWFSTWHDEPMGSDAQLLDLAATARADIERIDKMLDPRLVASLPKPEATPRPQGK